jgi:chemotaxis protein CheX
MERELSTIVETIWATVVGMGLQPADPLASLDEGSLTGCICFTGGWEATMLVGLPEPLARAAAAAMFGCAEQELSAAEVGDAVGEIANIAAGNLRAFKALPCETSLPSLVDASSYAALAARACRVARVGFRCGQESLIVEVFESEAAAP